MNDSLSPDGSAAVRPPMSSSPNSAGGLLRQAREAKGIRLDVLAASIKVTTAKLEALETDRFDRLPDATFTRALAQAVCRSLKTDPAPVLALLPPPNGHRLEEVAEGLKTPFTERPGRLVPAQWLKLSAATVWIALLLVAGAVVLYVMPAGWINVPRARIAASAASAPDSVSEALEPAVPGAEPGNPRDAAAAGPGVPASGPATEPLGSPTGDGPSLAAGTAATSPTAATAATEAPAASTAAAASAAPLQFVATAPSWIGVTDATGKSLIGRLVQPGETVGLDGASPFTLRVGHASTVQLRFRGETVDLKKYIRDDVARLQLK